MKHTAHQSMNKICQKYETSMEYVAAYSFHISYGLHTFSILWASKGPLAPWGGPGQGPRGPPHRVPGPPQGAKDPVGTQSIEKVAQKYAKTVNHTFGILLQFVWNTCGMLLADFWHTFTILLVNFRHTCGILLVYFLYTFDIPLACFWDTFCHSFGILLVYVCDILLYLFHILIIPGKQPTLGQAAI